MTTAACVIAVIAPLLSAILLVLQSGEGQGSASARRVGRLGVFGALAALAAGIYLLQADSPGRVILGNWLDFGPIRIDWAARVDGLAPILIIGAASIALAIKAAMTGIEKGSVGYARRSALIDCQLMAANLLFLADDLIFALAALVIGGFTSHLALAEEDAEQGRRPSELKSFIAHRCGDAAFVLGAALLILRSGRADFEGIRIFLSENPAAAAEGIGLFGISTATAIALCFSVALAIKAAQFPMPQWQDDEARSPLLAGGLMQTLGVLAVGVYLLCRLDSLFAMSPTARIVLTTVGGLTALGGATAAIAQWRIDRVLAFSSTSQIGFAMVAAGLGQPAVALSFLLVHALAKTALIVAMAAVVRGLGGERDLRGMGGIRKRMPFTFLASLVACVSLAGLPPFAGFFAQGDVLAVAGTSRLGHGWFLWLLLSLAAFCTAMHLGRLILLVFSGRCRARDSIKDALEEPPLSVTGPLFILSGGLLALGLFEVPGILRSSRSWRWFLEDAVGRAEMASRGGTAVELAFLFLSVMVGVGGVFVAVRLYLKDPQLADRLALKHRDLFRLWRDRYRIDSLYAVTFREPVEFLSRKSAARVLDRRLAEGAAQAIARILRWLGTRVASLRVGAARIYIAVAIGGVLVVLLSLLT